MRFKKILIIAAVVIGVLIAGLYVFLAAYDFNRLKPMIARAVKDATGRELNIVGNVDVGLGIPPTLRVEDVGFQNAAWSTNPNLARVKHIEAQVALLPLILGKLDFTQLVLIEPEVIVEFNETGISNFTFDTVGEPEVADGEKLSPPPLIFSDVQIEKGLLTYRDAQSDFSFVLRIDRLKAEIPGFEESLSFDFRGAFNDIETDIRGSLGPIWAWVAPGYPLPADFTLETAGAEARLKGEIRDPLNFKGLTLAVTAQGPSIADVAKLAGADKVPELGAFKISANIADPDGKPAVQGLDIQVGAQDLAEISLSGDVKDVLNRRGISLNFAVRGNDAANLAQFGLPPPPARKAFGLSGAISDTETNIYSISGIKLAYGEDEISGRVDVNLADTPQRLTADLNSEKFILGPLKLAVKIAGTADRLALEKMDLLFGSENLATINLSGSIKDLLELQGANLNFNAQTKDLANLEEYIGQSLPLRGAFSAAGKVETPVHNHFKIPKLQITAGKNRIDGSVDLNLTGKKPRLNVALSSRGLNLQQVLIPELAKQDWVKPLERIRPIKLSGSLSGFAEDFAVEKVDLQAGGKDIFECSLSGAIENLPAQRGIDLKFSMGGKEFTKLKGITGEKYWFAPIPVSGSYALSGRLKGRSAKKFGISDLKMVLGENHLRGRLDADLAARSPYISVEISAPRFNLKSLRVADESRFVNLMKLENLGPVRLNSKVLLMPDYNSLDHLDFQFGSDQLLAIDAKGSVKNLTNQTGIDLRVKVHGKEIAHLEKITGQSLPLRGAYAVSGKISDPGAQTYRLGDLKLILGQNNITGRVDLNLATKQLKLDTELSTANLTLQPLTLDALKPLAGIEDLGPLKLVAGLAGSGKEFALKNLDFNLGNEQLVAIMLKGKATDLATLKGLELEFDARGSDLANLKKMGGPQLPLKGPFSISGTYSDPTPNIYKIPALKVTLGENDAEGSLELDFTGQRPKITADLSSQKIDLRPVWEAGESKKASSSEPVKSGKKPGKVFSSKPFQLEGLKAVDADLKMRNQQLILPKLAFDDVAVDLKLENGNLTVKPIEMKLGEGTAGGWFTLFTRQGGAAIDTDFNFDKLDLGAMFDAMGTERLTSGALDGGIDVSGQGNSVAELMAGLNGRTYLVLGKGQIARSQIDLISMNLGSAIFQILNPFQDESPYTERNCAVNRVDFQDGLAKLALLMDTEQTTIIAGGDINLKNETLSIGIKPSPKKGFLQGSSAGISLNLSELSRPFKLGGTLAQPALAIDPGRSLLTLGKLAGVVVFGPVGVVAFLADFSGSDENACLKAIESAKKKDEAKKEKKKSGGFFKRLFGK
jgi:uncharacterized protein involved in outer membrane biogenesis